MYKKYRSRVKQRGGGEGYSGATVCGAERLDRHSVGVSVEVSAEVYLVSASTRRASYKACVVAGESDMTGAHKEQVNATFARGESDSSVRGYNGVVIDDDG